MRMSLVAAAMALAFLVVTGCADAEPERAKTTSRELGTTDVVPTSWYSTAQQQLAASPDPNETLAWPDFNADCLLRDGIEIAAGTPQPSGAGTAKVGAASAYYFCRFIQPFADLGVIRADPGEYESLKDEYRGRPGQTEQEVTVGRLAVLVVTDAVADDPSTREVTAYYFDDEHHGIALLHVKAGLEPSLRDRYGEDQVAQDLIAALQVG